MLFQMHSALQQFNVPQLHKTHQIINKPSGRRIINDEATVCTILHKVRQKYKLKQTVGMCY